LLATEGVSDPAFDGAFRQAFHRRSSQTETGLEDGKFLREFGNLRNI
jgi:hypothetical protein